MNIKTILNETEDILIIERSKFISYLIPCENKKEIEEKLLELRKKHFDATHVCYGYIVYENDLLIYKSSDDGEPSQTAGAPILNVLKRNELCNVLCVVVRYFGGIKLGAGGLTRAYSNSAIASLSKAEIVEIIDAFQYEFIFKYDQIKDVDKIVLSNNLDVIDKIYDMVVHYFIISYDKESIEALRKKISYMNVNILDGQIIKTKRSLPKK